MIASSRSTKILHISDIHAGHGELRDEDGKSSIPNAERQRLLERLSRYLRALDKKPDFVVISGDITIQGRVDGYKRVREWVIELQNEGVLPESDRIIIVPGNHDVTRLKRFGDDETIRFHEFWLNFGKLLPHAYIPGHDPEPDPVKHAKLIKKFGLSGGIQCSQKAGEVVLTASLPFLIDMDRKILIYGFNSAHGCGAPLSPDSEILKSLSKLKSRGADVEVIADQVEQRYLDSLIVDAGMLTDNQLQIFNKWMDYFERSIGKKFGEFTKIATLHHHIGHLWRQQLELKVFESTVDAPQFKQYLIERGFDMVLHGHKHTNHIGIDSSVIPISEDIDFNPLISVSGGTVGGHPRLGDNLSFKILELNDDAFPRRNALIHEIPLEDAGNPRIVIENRSKQYSVTFYSRTGYVHQIGDIKSALDEHVARITAHEIEGGGYTTSKSVSVAPRMKDTFDQIKFNCFALASSSDSEIFFDVILAAGRLQFETFARVRWLVSDAVSDGQSTKVRKVVLLIGDLSETHFNVQIVPGEIEQSIQRLRGFLAPAISAGFVELRVHKFKQDEAMDLARKALVGK